MNLYNENYIPKLRGDIDLIPTLYQGKKAIFVRDSLGLIQKPILLQGEIIEFLSLIDGRRNIKEFQVDLMRRKGGVFVSSKDVESLLLELDSVFLLDSERYHQAREKIINEYSLLKVRTPFYAGNAYAKEPEKLRSCLEDLFHSEREDSFPSKENEVAALVSPHIDLEAGKKVYANAYKAIKNYTPQRVILLGTGHKLQESFFSLTEKDFETPLGRVNTDKGCVKRLREAGKEVIAPSDIAHRGEHSLEFQLVFLQYLFPSGFSLVPILCGSFHMMLERVSRPSEIPGISPFLEELRSYAEKPASDTLFIAGVDFSHIGPKFGHRQSALSMLLETKDHDKKLFEAICRGNVREFWEETRRSKDKYNVCGFSTIAFLLEILRDAQGHLLGYEVWHEEATQSAVSFAAIALEQGRTGYNKQ